jgi:hypothetical protein
VTGFTKPIEEAVEEDFAGSAPATDLLNISTTFGCLATAQELGRADFACDLELSYLNGSKAYSPPDSTAGGGVMALAPFFPPIDRHQSVAPSLPSEGSVPHMRDWVDHLVIFLSGGAPLTMIRRRCIGTNLKSAYAVAVQAEEMHGPPKCFTRIGARRNFQFKGWPHQT